MNLDPTTVIPDYPSAEVEKALDLEKYTGAPVKQGAAVPPVPPPATPPAKSSGGGGGLAIVAGIAGLAVIVGVAVVMSKSKRGKR